jgi:putative ABC transport system permease protein
MTSLRFVTALAWRDARASWRRLVLLTAAVMAGVGALVAINSFTENIKVSVAEQAQALLGADLALQSRASIDTSSVATALIDSLRREAGDSVQVARSASFIAMAYLPESGSARLVQVRTVDPGWPYYGAIRTEPAGIWATLQAGTMIVDPSLLAALGAQVGDTLALGNARLLVAGTVVNVPGEVGLQAAFGARVYIAHATLPTTGLLGFGARVEHTMYFSLPARIDPQDVAAANRNTLRAARVGLRTVADDRDNLTEGLTRLGNYLGLVALAALLLGGLGTASAVHVLIRQRLDSIAMLRCLGASSNQVIGTHLLQALTMGLIGSILGAGLGVALQQVMPRVLADFLPVDVRVVPSTRAILLGITLGLWTSGVFALLPLLGIRDISPLATLRRNTDPPRIRWDWRRAMAVLALVLSVVGLATVQVGSLMSGAVFAAAAAVALLVLWLTSLALIRLARRFTPRRAPYLLRQGLANLHRPGNQTVTVVIALGFGAFLLTTLFTAQVNLLRDLRIDSATDRGNLVLIDIQTDQHQAVRDALAGEVIASTPLVPIVPMRIAEVNGQDVGIIIGQGGVVRSDTADTGADEEMGGLWAWRREYRSTYRDSLGSAEQVIAGRWFTAEDRGDGRSNERPVAISVETDVATELGLELGDRVVWNVQGARIHSIVTSIREVNWARFEPNFFVIFAPGALESAPQSWVTLVRVDDPVARGRIQRTLAETAPNVTSVDLGEVQRTLESVIGRVVLAIRFMAMFSLATGAVVLVGAIATSRWQRVREGTLLRTLGASRGQVLRILSVEYAALGLAAALVAVLLAGVAGWALARWLFNSSFAWPLGSMAMLALALVCLTTVVGLWNSLDVLKRPPLEVLRGDG